jgi:hypothetical protein
VLDSDGKKKYQVSELERVFGTMKAEPRTGTANENLNQSVPSIRTEELQIKLAETLKEVELLRDRLRDKDERIEDLRQDRDRWHGEFQSLKALPAPTPPAPPEKRSFWSLRTKNT